tara:strand:+ start:1553 stop:1858 length:306 start_codon:yes stop_codon:yes gene_type:complete
MTTKEKVCEKLGITVTDYPGQDVNIYTSETADNYEVFVYTEDERRVNIMEDVFYYDDGIMAHIIDTLPHLSPGTTIYCSDEEWLMPDWVWDDIYEEITKED